MDIFTDYLEVINMAKDVKKKNKKKKSKWVRPRHKFFRAILDITLGTYSRIRYNIKIDRLPRDKRGQYLVLYNHQTAFDQFFVGISFPDPVYYLASEDIFSNGFTSKLIKYLVAPISIRKQTTDVSAIMNCLRVIREGGTIAIAPEGNRTYSGKTEYINPSIATLVRQLKLPVAIYRIEGGYGVHPRWSDVVRKGKMRSYVSRIIQPEELKGMTDEEITALISRELYVNEANSDNTFTSDKKAEYVERALYVCPECGLTKLESNGNFFKCTKCGLTVEYTDTTELRGVDRTLPFKFVNDWYEYQNDFVNHLDVDTLTEAPLFEDTAEMREVIPNKNKVLLKDKVDIALYGDKIVCDGTVWSFDVASAVVVLGKNKLNVYYDGHIYQFKGDKRFNALKYVNIYHRYKNIKSGHEENCFLGI